MNETILGLSVLAASILLTLVDPSKSFILEYVIISFVGYLCGRTQERVKHFQKRKTNDAESDTPKSRSKPLWLP